MVPYAQFVGDADPMPMIEATVARIMELTAGLSDEQLTTPPEPGKWSIHQILAHLADTELTFQVRVRFILFEDNPPLPAYDQDRWLNGWMREGETFPQTLERLRVLRESTVRLLRSAPPEDLDRGGVHSERGRQTAREYMTIIAGHDTNHIIQVTRLARLT